MVEIARPSADAWLWLVLAAEAVMFGGLFLVVTMVRLRAADGVRLATLSGLTLRADSIR